MRPIPLIAVLALGHTPSVAATSAPSSAALEEGGARESRHREGEDGPVILELGDGGLRPLHCRGHRFLAVVDRPGGIPVTGLPGTIGAAEKVELRRAIPTIESGGSPGRGAKAELPSVELPVPLARVLTAYESAWRRKDAAALAALFAEDGFVLASGMPAVRGRAAIERHYAGQGGPLSLRAFAYSAEGSTAYIIGGFARGKGAPDVGKFTLTLRTGAGGEWLIMSDMDNGNSRPK